MMLKKNGEKHDKERGGKGQRKIPVSELEGVE